MSAQNIKVKVKVPPVVVMEAEVARKIRQHARSSMKAEVCGVLIGSIDDNRTLIEACIAGINAAQGGAHVTFTQDTWEHIYKIKDQQYPDEKIVGWYHSHPGFGVFLSEHDLFIHENFFSSPQQVAWVYDPHTDEEGCFGWVGGKTEKLSGVRFGYSQSVELDNSAVNEYEEDGEAEFDVNSQVKVRTGGADRREPRWVTWATRIMGYIAILGFGFVLGHQYLAWRIAPDIRMYQEQIVPELRAHQELFQQCVPELRSCQARVTRMPFTPIPPSDSGTGIKSPQQPAQPQQKTPASAGKGNNGKH
jgi:proteasome lid subunit RPN8/RPN11